MGRDHEHHPAPDHSTDHDDHAAHVPTTAPVEHAGHDKHAGHETHAGQDAEHAMEEGPHAGHGGHDRHAGHSIEMFRTRFWVCLVLTIPVLLYAEGLWDLFGLTAPDLPGGEAVSFVLATAIYLYGGSVFLRSATHEIKARLPGMMTLVSVGITAAYLYSVATTFWVEGEGFYWELATLVDIMLLGHWIEMRAVGRAEGALSELAKLLPDTAERINGDRTEEVAVSELRQGDVVLVRPGGRIPADGEVVDGESDVDESSFTGESRPVGKRPGAHAIAGTVNGSGALRIRVTRIGEETALAGIVRLVEEASSRGVKPTTVSNFEALKGRGVRAIVDGHDAYAGGPSLLDGLGITVDGDLDARAGKWASEGRTVVHVIEDGRVIGAIALADVIRPESREAVRRLKDVGIRVAMITGDSEDVANSVAGELGLDEYFAQVLPEHKAERVKELQRKGLRVAMVGDGVNDAPALAQADVGIAIGAGTDVAIETAEVVLMRSDPLDVATAVSIGRGTVGKMRQNLGWAIGYNSLALPIAAGVFEPWGITPRPEIAAISMSGSSVLVAVNALALKRLHLPRLANDV